MLEIVLWICVAVAGLLLLDRLFLWMEEKGWVYYRKVKSKSSAADIFMGSNVFDPGSQHGFEAREEQAGEHDENDGDDDGKRKAEDRLT